MIYFKIVKLVKWIINVSFSLCLAYTFARLVMFHVYFRFLGNKDDIAKVRKCFAGLWSLDDADAVGSAVEKPDLFVLKPQREGGGTSLPQFHYSYYFLHFQGDFIRCICL